MKSSKVKLLVLLAILFIVTACGKAETDRTQVTDNVDTQPSMSSSSAVVDVPGKKPPNFLVMIGDDMSVETIGCYKIGSDPAKTPALDNLCNQGMRFDNFWSQPICSPTRATILAGQYGFRNGVGVPAGGPTTEYPRPEALASAPKESGRRFGSAATGQGNTGGNGAMGMGMAMGQNAGTAAAAERSGLYPGAYGLPAALSADSSKNYQTAAIGKWHLADDYNGGLDHPANLGFEHYSGNMTGGGVHSFYAWSKVINGKHTEGDSRYVTSVTVDDALDWLDNRNENEPWFLWLAFNAPHAPWGAPPDALLSAETTAKLKEDDSTLAHYQAMIEAMDTEIGRLLKGIDPAELENTYIIFLGDNGTPNQAVTPPLDPQKAKGTLYQGGINVPFFVTGPEVDGASVTKALANSVDLFDTILELAGTGKNQKLESVIRDSVSLVPVIKNKNMDVREFVYADQFGLFRNANNSYRTIRNDRYKLLRNVNDDTDELYDLQEDPWEEINLLEADLVADARDNYQELKQRLTNLVKDNSRFKTN